MQVSVEEALELIYENIEQKGSQLLPIEEALGLILCEDIVATHNLPPYDNSAMDGYAVKVDDADSEVDVVETIFAGDNKDITLKNSQAIKIMTGAKIPEGCEVIVPKENTTELQDAKILLPSELKSGVHIRLCGEDIKKGDKLLSVGDKLHAHQITLLASQGISHVKVYKKPRVAIFASGNELKMHYENVEDSYQLYNTNTPTLMARVQELGAEVTFIGTANDNLESIYKHIESSLEADLIITSGGVSVGDADFTKEAFAHFNMNTLFNKISIKPGKPTTFGKIGKTAVLNLPGNPLAAALNFELFAKAILLALSGAKAKYTNTITAKLKSEFNCRAGRRSLIPGYYDGESFEIIKKFAPGMVTPLAESNAGETPGAQLDIDKYYQEPMLAIDADGEWRSDDEWYYGTTLGQYIHLTVTDQWEKIEAQYGNSPKDDVVLYASVRGDERLDSDAAHRKQTEAIFRGEAVAGSPNPASISARRASLDSEVALASVESSLNKDLALEASLAAFDAEEGESVFSGAWAGRLQTQLAAQDALLMAHLQLQQLTEPVVKPDEQE